MSELNNFSERLRRNLKGSSVLHFVCGVYTCYGQSVVKLDLFLPTDDGTNKQIFMQKKTFLVEPVEAQFKSVKFAVRFVKAAMRGEVLSMISKQKQIKTASYEATATYLHFKKQNSTYVLCQIYFRINIRTIVHRKQSHFQHSDINIVLPHAFVEYLLHSSMFVSQYHYASQLYVYITTCGRYYIKNIQHKSLTYLLVLQNEDHHLPI